MANQPPAVPREATELQSVTNLPRIWNAKIVGTRRSGAVYVGRNPRRMEPNPFGNPFRVGEDGDRDTVLRKYEEWLWTQPELIAKIKSELRGKDLICWCWPKPCHAAILRKIANEV